MNRAASAMCYIFGVVLVIAALLMFTSGRWTTDSWIKVGLVSVMCFIAGRHYSAKADTIDAVGNKFKSDEHYEEYVALSKILRKKGAQKAWEENLLHCGHDISKARTRLLSAIPSIAFTFFETDFDGGEKIEELCEIAGLSITERKTG